MQLQLKDLFLTKAPVQIQHQNTHTRSKKLSILGLGDVGRTLAVALKIISSESIAEIGIFDLNQNNLDRVYMELSQIVDLNRRQIPIKIHTVDTLFNCDIFVFTASKFVPAVGSNVKDVRMIQLEANAAIVKLYIEKAKKTGYTGEFYIVSDPVDLLCKVAKEHAEDIGYTKLTADKIRGFGLGVMYGRALFYAEQMGVDNFKKNGRVYGPHGSDLIVLNDAFGSYDNDVSHQLTQSVVRANLDVRALGFKPYIAPAVSSGAFAISSLLEGNWHHSAVCFGNVFLGVRNRRCDNQTEIERIPYHAAIENRLVQTIQNLETNYAAYLAKP